MGVFKSERRIWTDVTDLASVVEQVVTHFRAKGYDVVSTETGSGAWDIDISRSGAFRTISGMRTALKVRLEPEPGSVLARAGVGILGQQALPTVITMLVFWPIIVTQVWGAVRAAKADDEAIAVIERALTHPAGGGNGGPHRADTQDAHSCARCGGKPGTGRFCTSCGAPVAAA